MKQALKFFEKGLILDYSQHAMAGKISVGLLKEKSIREILDKYNPLINH